MVTPRPASTVMLLRRNPSWQVLMVLRPSRGAFGGSWVFPGGALDPVDHDAAVYGFDDPWRAAAMRETAEEVGVFLTDPPIVPDDPAADVLDLVRRSGARFAPGRLRHVSTFVTPEGSPRRFDTRFFITEVAGETIARLREDELVDLTWIGPGEALERHEAGTFPMILPTVVHLRLMRDAADPTAIEMPGPFEVEVVDGVPTVRWGT